MKYFSLLLIALAGLVPGLYAQKKQRDLFPDGSPVPSWFADTARVDPAKLGRQFLITDYGVSGDSLRVQTKAIQQVIDEASRQGGGVVVIPKGVFLSGALFFKPGTHLYVMEGAVLKGSDDIADYPAMPSRMEGQNLEYFPALVNAYGVDGFTISGKGAIDGNGARFWEAFWQRRREDPKCTNLEVSRPRLLFVWNCKDVQVQDVQLRNSGFWTSHYYQCSRVKLLHLRITSPHETQKAPSTDAIDLDVCSDVLIKGCYLSVNDDAIALKGGKGPWADKDTARNGSNMRILIEDCEFGFCHSALTCGSEAIHNRNIVMRRCYVSSAKRVLWLKMRPDTPQEYEYISVEEVSGNAHSLIYVKPWKQFFDLQGRKDVPLSYSRHIRLKHIRLKCDVFFDVAPGEHDRLSDFAFEHLDITAAKGTVDKSLIRNFSLKDVKVNGTLIR